MATVYDQSRAVDLFLNSPEGQHHLSGIRTMLKGRQITEVFFRNGFDSVHTVLRLDNGSEIEFTQPELEIERLQTDFEAVFES